MILQTLTSIFYNGPYVWELRAAQPGSTNTIEQLHEGSFLYHIFNPGISVSMSGNKFKITRWGIGNIPMSGNSFVHVFVGKMCSNGSTTVVHGKFRLNLFVFGFALSWLSMAYLLGGKLAVDSAIEYSRGGPVAGLSNLIFGLAFPIFGTLMVLGFRRLARSNEREILDALTAKLGEPLLKPE